MAENTSFLMGIAGIMAAILFSMLGWLPIYILFGTFVIAGCLYGSQFFATGIIGGFASGIFAAMDWMPIWIYFTAVIIMTLFLAIRVAAKYVNTAGEQ